MTTNAHELGLSVIFESAVQHSADLAESDRKQPQQVIDPYELAMKYQKF